ncbi:MAG TPA: ArsA family ATPase [Acidimicrobiales bacterium]|nr:ArsA family ATPase [Acidimicrobiales bacterium]
MSTVSTRILLFTGKGGVGKTTVAAATALRCADAGLRTVVLSTDPAHSLSDAYGAHLDSTLRQVRPGLFGQQLDATERLEEVWGDIQRYLVRVLDWAGADAIAAEELAVLPGLDELFSLTDIKEFAESGDWDVVVVDCGPTAETIRLLSLPGILSWYMDRLFPAGRTVTNVLRPLLSTFTSLPVAGDEVFGATQSFYERLEGVRELLVDPELTSVRLVVNPERMVIAEAQRMATYLSLFGYSVDAVIANRLLPDDVTDPWFKAWKESHAEHLEAIRDGFAPLPVLEGELASEEIVGADALRAFGERLYDDVDVAAVLHRDAPFVLERRGDDLVLSIALPFADKDELDLGRRGDELLVRVGPHRRAVALPDSLRRRAVRGATMVGDRLEVTFAPRSEEHE